MGLFQWFRRLFVEPSEKSPQKAPEAERRSQGSDDEAETKPTKASPNRGRKAEDGRRKPSASSVGDVVVLPISDSIDLHTFAPRDVSSVVEEYLYEACAKGFEEVRVIHGKGKGVQRRIVQSVMSRHPAVASFRTAPPTRGGHGATLVLLRSKTPRSEGGNPPRE